MIGGSLVAIVTPMQTGQEAETALDPAAMQRLLDFHIEHGTDGIVAVGTTGESATLTEQEHCQTIEAIVRYVDGRVPVIAGTGANSTHEAIRLTEYARAAGADGCLLVTPYYNKPTQEGMYLHHKAIADAVDIPQILYNVPGRTACDMLPQTVARLSQVSNIIGIKEATGELDRVAALKKACGDDFILLSGDDETGCEFMLAGGDGVISVTANVAPQLMHDMCAAALAGNRDAASALDAKLQPLHRQLFLEANPIPVKWAVEQMGLMSDGIRLPLTWLSEGHHDAVRNAMTHAGI